MEIEIIHHSLGKEKRKNYIKVDINKVTTVAMTDGRIELEPPSVMSRRWKKIKHKQMDYFFKYNLDDNFINKMNVSICTLDVRFHNFGHNTIIVYICRHY